MNSCALSTAVQSNTDTLIGIKITSAWINPNGSAKVSIRRSPPRAVVTFPTYPSHEYTTASAGVAASAKTAEEMDDRILFLLLS